ncbi:hypothetical protein D3C87_2059550 [compost metagenome]
MQSDGYTNHRQGEENTKDKRCADRRCELRSATRRNRRHQDPGHEYGRQIENPVAPVFPGDLRDMWILH